jgi:hypothetical protein
VDYIINLTKIFNKNEEKLYFINYINVTFPSYIKDALNKLSIDVKKNEIEPGIEDIYKENIPFDINNNKSFNSSKVNENFEITSSLIYSYPEIKSIYYIIGTNTCKIAIIDIFFADNYL